MKIWSGHRKGFLNLLVKKDLCLLRYVSFTCLHISNGVEVFYLLTGQTVKKDATDLFYNMRLVGELRSRNLGAKG